MSFMAAVDLVKQVAIFIKDNKLTIGQYLKSVDKELTVNTFKRYNLNL